MSKIINPGNHGTDPSSCNAKSPLAEDLNVDPIPPLCDNSSKPNDPNLNDISERPDMGWLEDSDKKTGFGSNANCDPVQSGKIINDIDEFYKPNRNVVNRYSKALRGCNEAMVDLFRGIIVKDEQGHALPVPIEYATHERAVLHIIKNNVEKDASLVVHRPLLPLLAIHASSYQFDQSRFTYQRAIDYMRDFRDDYKPGFTTQEGKHERDTVFGVTRGVPINVGYTLYGWSLYVEDMDQMIEQILLKFSPIAYIRIRGVSWETTVEIESIADNTDVEPGDQKARVIKFQMNLTAKTYVPQPIIRRKAVLKTNIDIYNDTDPENINELLARLENAVKGFND